MKWTALQQTFLMLMVQIFKENIFFSHTKTVDYLN